MDGHGRAVLTLEPDEGQGLLVVTDEAGDVAYRAPVPVRKVMRRFAPPAVPQQDGQDERDEQNELMRDLREQADGELAAAGWVREQHWAVTTTGGAHTLTVAVDTRPQLPIGPQDQRALDALHLMTTMARGPVTSAALVPQIAPRWQAAATLLRRLVAAGQVRAVGRARQGKVLRTLYAPVGTTWAPTMPRRRAGEVD